MEDAMWCALDEGSFSYGTNAGDLVEHLANLALDSIEEHLEQTKENTQ